MSTSSIGSTTTPSTSSTSSNSDNPFSSVSLSDFLQLMITQLQNQDPTDPTDTTTMMQQIGEMESIQSTTELNTTLNSMAIGQNLSSATALMGQYIEGMDANGNSVNGTVDAVQIANGQPALLVGSSIVPLANIQDVISASALEQQ